MINESDPYELIPKSAVMAHYQLQHALARQHAARQTPSTSCTDPVAAGASGRETPLAGVVSNEGRLDAL